MKLTRILLLSTGLVVLIFMSVDYPFSMFTGQHTFISGKNVNCSRCHPDEAGNLSKSVYHSNLTCRTCHNVTFTPGEVAHAATIPECIQCHTNITSHINNTYAAHMPLFRYADISGIRRGSNAACFICHTNYSGNITFVYHKWINFTITNMGNPDEEISKTINDYPYTYMTFNYTISNVILGPETTYTVQIKNQGGSTHYWKNKSDISCVRCHKRIQLGNFGDAQGSQHAGNVADTVEHFGVPVQSYYHLPGHSNASYGGPTNAYCLTCHRNSNFTIYAAENPNLNSSAIHAALRLNCVVCHNNSGPYNLSAEAHFAGGHNSTMFFKEAQKTIPRKLMGSFCLACHRANNHAGLTSMYQCAACHGNCQSCHNNGVLREGATNNLFSGSGSIFCRPMRGFPGANITFKVYTEPWANVSSTWVNRSFSFY